MPFLCPFCCGNPFGSAHSAPTMNLRRTCFEVATLCSAFVIASASHATDWAQWRGPERNGISKETGLLKEWPKEGPKLLWEAKEIGTGFSTPAVVGDRLYIL